MSSPPGQMWQDRCGRTAALMKHTTHNTHRVSVISLKVEHKQHTNHSVSTVCYSYSTRSKSTRFVTLNKTQILQLLLVMSR